jgi:transcriptional regulator NrdR family protein
MAKMDKGIPMRCHHCKRATRVRSTRSEIGLTLRTRVCIGCRRRYCTEERLVEEIPIKAKKPDDAQRRAERELWHQLSTNLTVGQPDKE